MNKVKIASLVFMFLLVYQFSILAQPVSSNVLGRKTTNEVDVTTINYTKGLAKLPGLVAHDPIEIVGDSDFISQGWPGNGTWSDPFLISDLNITVSAGFALKIVNVTRPFKIRRCFMHIPSEQSRVVQLVNISNAIVSNCTVKGGDRGIFVDDSSNITIKDDSYLESEYGLYLENVHNLTISNNIFTGIGFYGIMLWPVRYGQIFDILFEDGVSGIGAYAAADSLIANNTFRNLTMGVALFIGGSNLVLQSNIFMNISGAGVGASSPLQASHSSKYGTTFTTNYNRILKNEFTNCRTAFTNSFGISSLFSDNTVEESDDGVFLGYSDGNYVVNNSIRGSKRYGIYIVDADNNRIYGNVISNSGIANAFDSGYNNKWDNGVDKGNIWDDYTGSGSYRIPGHAHSIDRWPERVGPPFIWIQNNSEIVQGIPDQSIVWRAYDANPRNYMILRNGSLVSSETWDGSDITYNVENLEIGIYNFTAVVTNVNNERSSAFTLVNLTLSSVHNSLDSIVLVAATVVFGIIVVVVFRSRRANS